MTADRRHISSLVPDGLRYRPDFITDAEEQTLVAALGQLPLKPFEFHGYLGKRRVLSFGLRYDYSRRGVESAALVPRPTRHLAWGMPTN